MFFTTESILAAFFCIEVVYAYFSLPLCFLPVLLLVTVAIRFTQRHCRTVGAELSARTATRPLHDRVLNKKWGITATQLLLHAGMTCWEYHILGSGAAQSDMILLYWVQIAVWIYEGASLCMEHTSERRKDFAVLLCHHVVTLALLFGSACTDNYKIGTMVLLYHDFTDIFIDALKLLNYMQRSGPACAYAVELVFALNLGMWVWVRLYRFLVDIILVVFNDFCTTPVRGATCYMDAGLCMLYGMHVWWTFLMLRIAYRMVSGENPHAAADREYEHGEQKKGIQ
jgi:hypothetical protein